MQRFWANKVLGSNHASGLNLPRDLPDLSSRIVECSVNDFLRPWCSKREGNGKKRTIMSAWFPPWRLKPVFNSTHASSTKHIQYSKAWQQYTCAIFNKFSTQPISETSTKLSLKTDIVVHEEQTLDCSESPCTLIYGVWVTYQPQYKATTHQEFGQHGYQVNDLLPPLLIQSLL